MTEASRTPSTPGSRTHGLLIAVLVGIGLLRAATLGVIPLLDRSEARYAEIGRVMVETDNWLTPQLEVGTPFWGKPPLHFWATALSLQAFGASGFAARLASLLGALAVLFVTQRVARRLHGAFVASLACLVLASSALFYTLAAQVSLDLTLAACTTGALGAFLLANLEPDATAARRLHWLGFLALGAGLLAKGPVVIALWAGTLALATLALRDLRWLRGVPWVTGIAIAAVVSVPWYLAAERSTPGFLDYFLVHENFLRFLVSDYGDRYGHGHILPYGTIWGFALLALLPWSPVILALAWRGWRAGALARLRDDPARAFLWAWSLAPLFFFTPSRSVVVTYVLPALPPIAVLLADALVSRKPGAVASEPPAVDRSGLSAGLLAGDTFVLFEVAAGLVVLARQVPVPGHTLVALGALLAACAVALWRCARDARPLALVAATALCIPLVDAGGRLLVAREIGALASTRELAASVDAIQRERRCELTFFRDVPSSARFYLSDAAQELEGDPSRLSALAAAPECRLVALRSRDLRHLEAGALRGLQPLRDFGGYVLFGNAAAGMPAPAALDAE